MVQCAILGCSSRSDTQSAGFVDSHIHFHRIPRDTPIRQKWLKAMNKSEANTSTRVCSLHFKKENYYITKQGFHKLSPDCVPEINLKTAVFPINEALYFIFSKPIEEVASSDEETNDYLRTFWQVIKPPEPNISNCTQSQQINTTETTSEFGRITNVMGSTDIKHIVDFKEDTSDSSTDEEMTNVQPLEPNNSYQNQQRSIIAPEIETAVNDLESTQYRTHGEEVHGDTINLSEDEITSNVHPQQQNINLPNQCKQNNSKEGSSIIKPGVQKYKITTPLERKLVKEVRRLKAEGLKRMEAIGCLLDQNRRLLEKNTFLEDERRNYKKVAQNENNET